MLKSKVVVITGAGGGLGVELSKAFIAEGATVIGLGRSKETLEKAHSVINSQSFSYFAVDISDFEQLQKVITKILSQFEHIDYLFNNAAVYPKVNFLKETPSDFSRALSINVTGVANCCKAVLPSMIKNDFGRVFNLGSWADLSPVENSAVYSASKGAIHALTKAIAQDIAHYNVNIQIHEWVPGVVKTTMSGFAGNDPAVSASWAVAWAKSGIEKKNCIFNEDQEWLPPKSFKEKIKAKLLFLKR